MKNQNSLGKQKLNDAGRLFVLLPIFDEANTIGNLISRVHFELPNCRIIAVNDGSRDKSLEVLESTLCADDILCSYKINMNVGTVFSEGINVFLTHGKVGDILVIMESDDTSEVKSIPMLVDAMHKQQTDVVIASRNIGQGGYRNFPLKRRILSYGANRLMRMRFPICEVRDYTIFFRVYSYQLLNNVAQLYGRHGMIRSKGFAANAELLVKIGLAGGKVSEIPYLYDYGKKKGPSKIRIFSTLIEYLLMWKELVRISKILIDKESTEDKIDIR